MRGGMHSYYLLCHLASTLNIFKKMKLHMKFYSAWAMTVMRIIIVIINFIFSVRKQRLFTKGILIAGLGTYVDFLHLSAMKPMQQAASFGLYFSPSWLAFLFQSPLFASEVENVSLSSCWVLSSAVTNLKYSVIHQWEHLTKINHRWGLPFCKKGCSRAHLGATSSVCCLKPCYHSPEGQSSPSFLGPSFRTFVKTLFM